MKLQVELETASTDSESIANEMEEDGEESDDEDDEDSDKEEDEENGNSAAEKIKKILMPPNPENAIHVSLVQQRVTRPRVDRWFDPMLV